jgi:RNA polymerase sigma-70 factor (ECF subfamily)
MAEIRPDSEETHELLRQARAGDRQAFERLFSRYRDYLRQVVQLRLNPRLRPRVDPSDVVQETQLEAFRRLADYLEREPMPFRLWLRKTAQERLGMLQRYHQGSARRTVDREASLPESSALQLAERLLAPGSTPSQRLSRQEVIRQVRQALLKLSAADHEVLLMRNLEGLSNQEVAQVLSLEPAAASQRYGRALLRLRNLLIAAGVMESQS